MFFNAEEKLKFKSFEIKQHMLNLLLIRYEDYKNDFSEKKFMKMLEKLNCLSVEDILLYYLEGVDCKNIDIEKVFDNTLDVYTTQEKNQNSEIIRGTGIL